MAFFNWSKTASSNATADSTINWSEGQAPSSINDSARAMMARAAEYRDDISGAIATGGTSTAYTVSSNQVFDTLAHMANQIIAFTPHMTSGATVTLNVDSLGAKPLRSSPNVELQAGVLIQGTPYVALYNNSDGVFYLDGFYGNPYNIPLGSSIEYWGSSAPNSSFVFMYGQAINRTTYASLFAIFSTTYGTGDGSTTFNVPDLRGRVVAGKDDMGGSAASRLTNSGSGVTGTTLGATGGAETQTLTLAQLPTGITCSGTVTVYPGGNNTVYGVYATSASWTSVPAPSSGSIYAAATTSGTPNFGQTNSYSASNTLTSNNTSGSAHPILPPTIVANRILRII